jgi:hypothetical protein
MAKAEFDSTDKNRITVNSLSFVIMTPFMKIQSMTLRILSLSGMVCGGLRVSNFKTLPVFDVQRLFNAKKIRHDHSQAKEFS